MVAGEVEREPAGRRDAGRFRPIEIGRAQHRLAEVERDHRVAAPIGETRQGRVRGDRPGNHVVGKLEAEAAPRRIVEPRRAPYSGCARHRAP